MFVIKKEWLLKQLNFTEKEWNDVADYRNSAEGHFFLHFDKKLKEFENPKKVDSAYDFMIEVHNMNPNTPLDIFLVAYLNLCYKESKGMMDKTIREARYQLKQLNAERHWLLNTWND